jgi:ParB family chromosome partitioning protein
VLNLDMRQWWTATAGSYFGQVSKGKIEEAVRLFAPGQSLQISSLKKSVMASEAARLAVGSGWLPAMLVTEE